MKRLRRHPYMVPIIGLLVGVSIVGIAVLASGGKTYGASNSHVVNLYVDGKDKVVPTKADTVGDLIKNLHIDVLPQDVVEPSRDTKIEEDNFRVNIYRARPLTIVDEKTGERSVVYSAQKSPRVVTQEAGIPLYPEDQATFERGSLKENVLTEKVVIDRATPVNLNLYGTPITIRTHANTVADLISEKQIKLSPGDTVQPAPTTELTTNLPVFIVRNGTKIVTIEQVVPVPIQTIEDASLSFGTSVIRQQGTPGKKAITYQITTTNGKESGRVKIQETVIEDAVPQIVARGKTISIPSDKESIMAAAGVSSGDYGYVNYIISRESGWCATKWQGQVGYCPGYYQPLYSPTAGVGYGLCQSTPAGKMASAGADWATNAVTQLRWCSGYATSRYGSWGAAYNHWQVYHNW